MILAVAAAAPATPAGAMKSLRPRLLPRRLLLPRRRHLPEGVVVASGRDRPPVVTPARMCLIRNGSESNDVVFFERLFETKAVFFFSREMMTSVAEERSYIILESIVIQYKKI